MSGLPGSMSCAGAVHSSVSKSAHVQMFGHVKVEMKAVQPAHKRKHTEAEAHDKTNQKKSFPVHVKPRLSPARSSLPAAAKRSANVPPAAAFPESRPSAPGSGANLHAWPDSAAPGSPK